jgi:hypothetical protein
LSPLTTRSDYGGGILTRLDRGRGDCELYKDIRAIIIYKLSEKSKQEHPKVSHRAVKARVKKDLTKVSAVQKIKFLNLYKTRRNAQNYTT